MVDFVGDLLSAAADLAHELKSGFGTVLTILGSKLEADARARVDASVVCAGCGHARVDHVELVGRCGRRVGPERVPCGCKQFVGALDGPQWLTEFEEQRDSLAPGELRAECTCPTERCELLDEDICDEAEAADDLEGLVWVDHDYPPLPRNYENVQVHIQASAAVSAAADPSPNNPRMGDRPGSDSVILPTVEPGPQTEKYAFHCQHCGFLNLQPVPPVVAGESPREEDEQPSLGEPATEEDLAAHITAELISGVEGEIEWLTQCFIDGISTTLAKSVMSGFNVFTK